MFGKRDERTTKVCANGHVQDPSWEQCPHCHPKAPGDAARAAELKRTMIGGSPAPRSGGNEGARRTVVLRDQQRPPVVGWLVAMDGPQKGDDYRIRDEQTLVGSGSECQIILEDQSISTRHVSIRYQDGKFTLTDLDSSNGTEVNGAAVSKVPLADGDKVRMGSTTLVFKSL
jgi:FHA domain-containing protein